MQNVCLHGIKPLSGKKSYMKEMKWEYNIIESGSAGTDFESERRPFYEKTTLVSLLVAGLLISLYSPSMCKQTK